jgi:hypothetical protein
VGFGNVLTRPSIAVTVEMSCTQILDHGHVGLFNGFVVSQKGWVGGDKQRIVPPVVIDIRRSARYKNRGLAWA